MPPPLLCMKIFDKRIFLKHQNVLQWNISVQWDKNFDGKSWYPPLLSIKYFSIPEIFWNTEWFPGEVFSVLWDEKIFDKTVMPPPLLCMKIFDKNFSETPKCSPMKYFGTVRQKLRRKIVILPPPYPNFFDTRNYCNSKGFPYEFFGTVRQKIFDGKSWYPLPPLWCLKFFATRNFLIHRSVPQRNFSVLWDKKFWTKSRA